MPDRSIEAARMEKFIKQFADSPTRLGWVEVHLGGPVTTAALLEAVDDSSFSLAAWIDAFIILEQWLEVRGRHAAFEDQLGYVHCACEAAGAGVSLTTLAAVVSEMLDDYGFESAEPKWNC